MVVEHGKWNQERWCNGTWTHSFLFSKIHESCQIGIVILFNTLFPKPRSSDNTGVRFFQISSTPTLPFGPSTQLSLLSEFGWFEPDGFSKGIIHIGASLPHNHVHHSNQDCKFLRKFPGSISVFCVKSFSSL